MIFYFSGTGNSLAVAKTISTACNDTLRSIPEEMKRNESSCEYLLGEGEPIGFVYPVYAWAPPAMVLEFIEKLSIPNYEDNFIFSVATCGDFIGNTMEALIKVLKKKGLTLHSSFSVVMPSNYIILSDVDSEEIEEKKLREADIRMKYIAEIIRDRKRGVFDVKKGPVPVFLTNVINPLFNKYARTADKFYATDVCTSCGRCEEICPVGSIAVNGKPAWGKDCTQCLACINSCPVKAIQYGKKTINKGRYLHPILRK